MQASAKLVIGLFWLTAFAAADDVNTIVARMAEAQNHAKTRMRPYQAVRKYQIFKGSEQKSEITAEVRYVPPQEKSFTITQSGGGTPERVVKKALEHEVEVARDPRNYAITPDNYYFNLVGEQACAGSSCFVVEITPKRECKDLVKGRIWVDRASYLLRRLEGEPAKSPSWWVKKASVVIEYGEVNGMWMQTSSVADANLRMVGQYRLVSRQVDVRTETTVAARAPRPSFGRRIANSTVISGSGFFLPASK